MTIGLATVDYYIRKSVDDIVADDGNRTEFVLDIHDMAKSFKAEYGALFDAAAISAALSKI
jgi:hypothetical protein